MKCLIIEDSAADIMLMKSYISRSRPNAKIVTCKDFISGAKHLYREAFDVIFLDLNLPDNWGINTITELKKYSRVAPIIVTTGIAGRATIEEAKKAGAALIFEKREINSETIAGLIGKQEMVG